MIILNMMQVAKFKWNIVSQKGHIIKTDIFCQNKRAAEDYIRAYISSFYGYDYKVYPLDAEE